MNAPQTTPTPPPSAATTPAPTTPPPAVEIKGKGMELKATRTTPIQEERAFNGLFELVTEHEIKSSASVLNYKGPKITQALWWQILAFFRWTQEKWRSESQVRLFVNPITREWGAHALPQEADTGMAARELADHPRAHEHHTLYPNSAGWVYWGTVHHHCSAGAFQSSTDEQNERNQEGLHITMGFMDRKTAYDLHARFYIDGMKFDPDMTLFWQVTEEIVQKAADLKKYFSMNVDWASIARVQMCQPPPEDTVFPDAWRENVIVKVREPYQNQNQRGVIPLPQPSGKKGNKKSKKHGGGRDGRPYSEQVRDGVLGWQIDHAVRAVDLGQVTMNVSDDELVAAFSVLLKEGMVKCIVDNCIKSNITPEELFDSMYQTEEPTTGDAQQMQDDINRQLGEGGAGAAHEAPVGGGTGELDGWVWDKL